MGPYCQRMLCLALVGLVPIVDRPALAQDPTGSLLGTVTDTHGNVLVGASIELDGMGAPRLRVTDETGAFRFVGLDPGEYRLQASFDGYSTVEQKAVSVYLGRSTSIEIQLPNAIGEVITVLSEIPLLDERTISTGLALPSRVLDEIPTARNPWALYSQVPGVLTDHIDVGGSWAGKPGAPRAPGIDHTANTYQVDGVDTGDMENIGGTPSFFDLDQFSEIQFGVGGPDVSRATGGVSMNLVTKRGTNVFRGSARFYRIDRRFFGVETTDPVIRQQPDSSLAPNQPSFVGNSVRWVDDYGFEAGGPVLTDRLWFWGSFAIQGYDTQTSGTTVDQVEDDGRQYNYAAFKGNWQIAGPNSFVATWNTADSVFSGLGASLTRPLETTWDHRAPADIYKLEDAHVLSPSLFLSGSYAWVDGGFALTSKACITAGGCEAAPEAVWGADGVWRNSFLSGGSTRTSSEIKLSGSYFFAPNGSSTHELKFGGRLRSYETVSTFAWPGRRFFVIDLDLFGVPGILESAVAQAGTDGPLTSSSYRSLWVQDTITLGRWTFNAGLRYDLQNGRNEAEISEGNDTFSDALPELQVTPEDAPFDWSTILPRLGVTYALGEARRSLLRASFSQFAQQLSTQQIYFTSPAGLRYGYYYFLDVNENLAYDDGDVNLGLGFCDGCPEDTSSPVSPNQTDSKFKPEIVTEVVLALEHSVLPELVVGANYTYRDRTDIHWLRPLIELPDGSTRAARRNDWQSSGSVPVQLPDGSSNLVEVYSLRESIVGTGGELQTNSDRSVVFHGIGLDFTKRLSNRWMARGFVQYARDRWVVPASYAAQSNPNPDEFARDVNGTLYGQPNPSSRFEDVFSQSRWSWNLNGMVQIALNRPWGFNIAANLYGREGYPLPYYFVFDANDGLGRQNISVLNGDLDRFRADDIFTTDLRLEKEFATTSSFGLIFSVDVFNLFDSGFVIQRERQAGIPFYDWLSETLAPRIWRLGVRFQWGQG